MQLLLHFGNAHARLHNLAPRIVIGGDPASCQLVFQDGSVGHTHAEVYLDNGTPFIRDLGSRCGTWNDGVPVTNEPSMLRPGSTVLLGAVPLVIQQEGDVFPQAEAGQPMQPGLASSTAAVPQPMATESALLPIAQPGYSPPTPRPIAVPADLEARAHAAAAAATSTSIKDVTHRRQASNSNGVLLVALRGDTFAPGASVAGHIEFTSMATETISSIVVELLEHHPESSRPQVYERVVLQQGPWNAQRNDTVQLPFALTSSPARPTGSKWDVRAYVDVSSGFHLECLCPIYVAG